MVLFVLLFCSLVVSVDAALMWSQTYGGTGYETAYSLVATSDGGYALAGETSSFGAEKGDFWLVKTDAFGNKEWNQTYGGTGRDWASSLVATSDGGYAIAGTWKNYDDTVPSFEPVLDGDFWLVKTDANGVMEWNRTYGGTGNDEAYSLVATSDGGYALAGIGNQTSNFWGEGGDFWLVKTDANGVMRWNRTYGGTGNDEAHSLVVTSDGGYAIADTWNYSSYVAGNGGDLWLVKTDASGNMQWNRTYGGTGNDEAYSLVATSDGGYALAGTWNHTDSPYGDEFWLIKTDAFGNMLWNTTYGATWGIERAYALVATADDGYAIAGYTTSFGGGSSDFWLIKTNASGQVAWNQTYGGLGSQNAYSVIQTSDGGYALTGYIDSGAAGYDFWLVKTDEFGVVPEYSSWLIPALVLTATAFILINKKRLLRARSQRP